MADSATDPAANGNSVNSLKGNAQAAFNQLSSGPVAQNVKDQGAKTTAEFSNLANARQTPTQPAATGQPLTHYHSFFSELLSWNNPRASAIAYASVVSLIFVARYLDLIRYTFKLTYLALGVTVLAEAAGKATIGTGLATQLRPRKYYTVPRETLDSLIGDFHELINFFVIESQRVFFAENVSVSAVAALGAFLSYYLVKIVPYWGLALISTTLLFFVPLIYTTNQELIDHYLKQASDVVESQTVQLRQVASKHTSQATEITKQYMGDYTAKAQQMLRGRSASPEAASKPAQSNLKESDFPKAPKEDLKGHQEEESSEEESEEEPLISA
ncbi:Reticulon-domain-containing protein [Annulohypoxylon truncatum]|uniref:Reticulon-domain-containing protein n=1 Tax=Annulohypoxylon truncatum TaxID=327061 RepID=UPI002007FB44|nr:Reticulon-domain-containing protein [Annulohypoxylon truncatum]KAI1209886.1 Reticulon-domain-containing protein [Annulohypoxylon truncatum]